MVQHLSADIVIIGSGMGGATMAYALAHTGARILVLERGGRIARGPEARSDRAIFQQGLFRTKESWKTGGGESFNPGNFYYVGGNSKMFGGVLYRYRTEDFRPMRHLEGETPGWPIAYDDIEPWYGKAEQLFQVRGAAGEDPTEPPHSTPYEFPPVPDEPSIAAVRARLKGQGIHPASLPLAVDHVAWLSGGKTPWDGFPNTGEGKIDAETGPLRKAMEFRNVEVVTNAMVRVLETDGSGRRVVSARATVKGEEVLITGGTFVVAAGAVNTAALLLRSKNSAHGRGLANRSDQVGRNFMNHNCTAMVTVDPRLRNTSVYQKTFGFNDFYLKDPKSGFPLGNVQLLGKISGPIFKANMAWAPGFATHLLARYSFDWYLMSEDLPNPESRVMVNGGDIILDWQRSNGKAHALLIERVRDVMKAAGFPIVMARGFDKRTPSHQCGTARMGNDPASSVVDPYCRAHDLDNLLITDASVLPTSAAVNPSLTIVALALRAAAKFAAQSG